MSAFPGVPGVSLERDVACPLRDGVTAYADVYRPDGGGPHPVLLISAPYDKTSSESDFGFAHPSWYASHGYLVVCVDTRGRHRSGGQFEPFVREAEDVYDAIEWAARLPGADGRVAHLRLLVRGPEPAARGGPATACPRRSSPAFTAARVHDGWFWKGGAFSLAFAASWANFLALDAPARRGDEEAYVAYATALGNAQQLYWVLPLEAHPGLNRERRAVLLRLARASRARPVLGRAQPRELRPDRRAGPARRGLVRRLRRGHAAQLRVAPALGRERGGPRRAEARRRPLAPHAVVAARPRRRGHGPNVVDDWQLRFFDHVLKGSDTGIFDAPVSAYLLGEGWRELDAWPPSGVEPTAFFLHSGGRANGSYGDGSLSRTAPGAEPADVYVYDPAMPTPSLGGHSCCLENLAPMGPADQAVAERSKGRARLQLGAARTRPRARR